MGLLCCFVADKYAAKPSGDESSREARRLAGAERSQLSNTGQAKETINSIIFKATDFKSDRAPEHTHRHGSGPVPAEHLDPQDALLQLLSALTSLDGGWWDQLERALAATAQHLSATHACIYLISGDSAYASPLALVGAPAPPLSVGTPLPLGRSAGHGPTVCVSAPAIGSAPSAEATPVTAAAAAATAGSSGAGPSCAAAALLAEAGQSSTGKETGRTLLFADSGAASDHYRGVGALPSWAPLEWRHLAAAGGGATAAAGAAGATAAAPEGSAEGEGTAAPAAAAGGGTGGPCRHFAAVVIPAGQQPLGALSLGAEGPGRPACWAPQALHCTAAMLSAPLRVPQVDLACRALSELSSATTIHQLVRTILAATSELVVTVTRIETQARVAFVQSDIAAAAVFQSAATDALGPTVRRRMSEVLLVDTSAAGAGGGGGGGAGGGGLLGILGGLLLGGAGGGRSSAGGPGPPMRRSLGGTEAVGSRPPSVVGVATTVEHHRDSFARGAHAVSSGELSVCRGHSLPLKHTLLSEALAQGTGLCIADCNAYVQDSKVYPRDLAVSRGAAPAQSLALATSCHCGKPLLALYATYHSILPQALLQTVVQELGQLLRALTDSVAAKVQSALAAEWGHLRHQLLESMRNRSLRSVGPVSTSGTVQRSGGVQAAPANGSATDTAAAGHIPPVDSPVARNAGAGAAAGPLAALNGGSSVLLQPAGGGNGTAPYDSPAHAQSVAISTGTLNHVRVGTEGGGGGASGSMGLLERSRGVLGAVRDGRTSGRASFSLEAANSPRGSSKLAPLIATLHDRLKAAQAEQMANCRAASRMQDLESIRVLEQIGRGGYGVVYRGLYHGSEVAIKVIQEAEVAAAGASGDQGAAGALRRMSSVALENKHLHDAIELVASVGMGGHPNIVQVLTFFTDVRVVVGDEPVGTLNRRLSGLDGVAELLRLTRMPSVVDSPLRHEQAQAAQQQNAGGPGQQQQQQSEGNVPQSGGVIVLVQEFCDAGTLKNAINQRAFYRNVVSQGEDRQSRGHLQLNLKAVYSTLLEVALALRHMHGLHMVHCDLKPQNVLLKSSPRDPRGFTAKLSDFGLAKMMAHDDDGQLVIDEAVGSGTLTHMAPESLAGQKQLTASIDMFAFGILMWQMVCGTRLYQGLNTKQIIRGVVRENLRPVFPAWVPPEYRRLAERCWHVNPTERPTASAVVAELEAMVDQHSRASASAAAAAVVSAWRPSRNSNQGPATVLDSPGSPRRVPQGHQPTQLQQLQQLQQQLHQQLLQQQVAAAAAAHLYGGSPGGGKHAPAPNTNLRGPPTHPQPPQPQQQQQQGNIPLQASSLPPNPGGVRRAGSHTGMGPAAPTSGLGPSRLII